MENLLQSLKFSSPRTKSPSQMLKWYMQQGRRVCQESLWNMDMWDILDAHSVELQAALAAAMLTLFCHWYSLYIANNAQCWSLVGQRFQFHHWWAFTSSTRAYDLRTCFIMMRMIRTIKDSHSWLNSDWLGLMAQWADKHSTIKFQLCKCRVISENRLLCSIMVRRWISALAWQQILDRASVHSRMSPLPLLLLQVCIPLENSITDQDCKWQIYDMVCIYNSEEEWLTPVLFEHACHAWRLVAFTLTISVFSRSL